MKNYLVIGASSGIGKALANQLIVEHYKVYGTYYKNIPVPEGSVSYHPINVMDAALDFSFLPEKLDGLIYCPGTINLKPFHRFTETDFLNDWQINVMGAIKTIQTALPKLKLSGNASIILFSTVAVAVGMPFHASIAAAKGAVEGLTRSLAAELAPVIRVNCIAPSLTNTPLAEKLLSTPEKTEASEKRHPLQSIGQPADIAAMAAFLLSDNAKFITGQIIHIDGGMSGVRV